jgi:hypothetical protein
MPTIDWTADQGEEVRQLILDRLDWVRARRPSPGLLAMERELREILTKLEAAYAQD